MPVRIRHDATIIDTPTPTSEGTAPMPETSIPDRRRITRVTDSAGRVLGVRPVGVLQRLRLLEAVGPESARNQPYFSLAMLAAAVVEIDGELCEPIATKRQLEARAQQLDEHGLLAAGLALRAADAASAGEPGRAPEDLAKNG